MFFSQVNEFIIISAKNNYPLLLKEKISGFADFTFGSCNYREVLAHEPDCIY